MPAERCMRASIIRLIRMRELRDQLRDRRTIFMIVVLPLVLYPALGLLLVQLALNFQAKTSVIGIQGMDHLPPLRPNSAAYSPLPAVAWFSLTPVSGPIPGANMERLAGAVALVQAVEGTQADPPLVVAGDKGWHLPASLFADSRQAEMVQVRQVGEDTRALLEAREVDAVLMVPPDFQEVLRRGGRPSLRLECRHGDEQSQLAAGRLETVLEQWKRLIKEARLRRQGLPADFDDPIEVRNTSTAGPLLELDATGLRHQLIRMVPFMLVLWSLAGALYPAVDVCAGEKERGTMETLLISPASREEIVGGKFLTIWVFSAATTFWNLVFMGGTTWAFADRLPLAILTPAAVCWCVVSVLPLTAFFSAVCLALGVYARSSKEGQYYLMPLFLATMPLVCLTLSPGVELNPFYSLVPVTGVALLMQRLIAAPCLGQVPWLYFGPVLAAVVLYSLLALRWAIEQFQREEVLFREAERLDLRLWLRGLLRDKETLPSAGQALFCFGVILALRGFLVGSTGQQPLLIRTGIAYVALLAPPFFMALMLTSQPRRGLGLRWPPLRSMAEALLLAVLLFPPLMELGEGLSRQFPAFEHLLNVQQPILAAWSRGPDSCTWASSLALVLLGALGEELIFRGFILSGLRHRFTPRTAIVLSSLLFAFYQLNAFRCVPAFAAGMVLGLLTVRSGSILPGIVFHFCCSALPLGQRWLDDMGYWGEQVSWAAMTRAAAVTLCSLLAGVLLLRLGRHPVSIRSGLPVLTHLPPAGD